MTYPRYRNGHMDDGSLIKAHNREDRCPNCGSTRYRETVSLESCDACGLRMDYWGGGGNQVYQAYQAQRYARLEAEEQARQRKQYEEWQAELDHWHRGPSDSDD